MEVVRRVSPRREGTGMTTYEDVQRFKALADPTRLTLLHIISHGDGLLNVMDLRKRLNAQLGRNLAQPTISHHLSILRDARLIDCAKDEREAFYQLRNDALTCAMEVLRTIARRQEVGV